MARVAVRAGVGSLPPVRRMTGMLLRDFRIPKETLKFITYPTRFDSRETERALKGSGITVPRLDDYAWRLWDYWERNLDPDLHKDRSFDLVTARAVAALDKLASALKERPELRLEIEGTSAQASAICARDTPRSSARLATRSAIMASMPSVSSPEQQSRTPQLQT